MHTRAVATSFEVVWLIGGVRAKFLRRRIKKRNDEVNGDL